MREGDYPDPDEIVDLAGFIDALARLRLAAGNPPYRTLARLVGPLLRPPQAVAHTTVTEVFQPKRRRLDLDLVMAIVRALGVDQPDEARWREACVRVHVAARSGGPVGVLRQLPADPADFTGRTEPLDRLIALATRPLHPKTVVISAIEGTAGVGKTQLAIHAAHTLISDGHFGDVQLYVNLRGFDPDHPPADPGAVLGAFLRQLQVPVQSIPDSLEERAAMFRDRTQDRAALVVLDNAADEVQVQHLIPASATCLVLITSRRNLAALDSATVFQLDVLEPAEAVELLAATCGADRVAAEPEAALRIVKVCGGLPIAIALAAARLRSHAAWSLAAMADRLERAPTALRAGGTDIRTVFAASVDGLPEPAKTVFGLLGLHPGPEYTPFAVAALAGIPVSEAYAMLELLLDENLLRQPVVGRYEMHDLLRHYVLELASALPTKTQEPARSRLVEHFTHTAHRAAMALDPGRDPLLLPLEPTTAPLAPTADAEQARIWFDFELPTVAILANAEAGRRPAAAFQLAWATIGYCRHAGYFRESIELLSVALAAAEQLGHRRAQAYSLTVRAQVKRLILDADSAEPDVRRAIEIYHDLGDPVFEARAYADLSAVLSFRGDHAAGLETARHARDLCRAAGNRVNEAQALNIIGWAHAHLGELDEALAACSEALAMFRELGDWHGTAVTLDSIAFVHGQRRDFAQAVETYRQVLDLEQAKEGSPLRARTLQHLGETYRQAGETEKAREAFEQALDIFERLGHPYVAEIKANIEALGG